MSEHIGKHLFCPSWGPGYVGVITGETPKQWKYKSASGRESRCNKLPKRDLLVDASIDPSKASAAWREADKAHTAEVQIAKEALSRAQDRRAEAARAALLRGAP